MSIEYRETVVVGAGQHGCGVAGALTILGHDVVVLERDQLAQAWTQWRWDKLLTNTPNWSLQFPGWSYSGDAPHGFMSAAEVADTLRHYAASMAFEVREHAGVQRVEYCPGELTHPGARFAVHLDTNDTLASRNVVTAVGGWALPRIPDLAAGVAASVMQMHSRTYRNSTRLPAGAVLVVGAGNSGQQIAQDLLEDGREVFLSVGRHKSVPSYYRGLHMLSWVVLLNAQSEQADTADNATVPGVGVTSGRKGTHPLNLGTLVHDGVTLVGSLRGADGTILTLEDNVIAVASAAAASQEEVMDFIDSELDRRGFDAPLEQPRPLVDIARITNYGPALDLAANGITSVIWATGYHQDNQVLPPSCVDEHGAPLHQKGIGAVPGLYHAGIPERDEASASVSLLIASVKVTAERIADQIHLDNSLRTADTQRLLRLLHL